MSVFGTLHNPHTTPPALERVGMPIAFPTGAQHVNFLGRYSVVLAEPITCGALRPLRDPNEYEGTRGEHYLFLRIGLADDQASET